MDLQTDIAARKERWGRFLGNDHPPRFMYFVHCSDPAEDKQNVMGQPHLWPGLKQERIEWAWQQYEAWMQTAAWRKDDWVPHVSMITGTEGAKLALDRKLRQMQVDLPELEKKLHAGDATAQLQSKVRRVEAILDELHSDPWLARALQREQPQITDRIGVLRKALETLKEGPGDE